MTYTYWQDPKDGMIVGYWNNYPDYVTQGHDLPELQFMLRDIRHLSAPIPETDEDNG